MKQRSEIIRKLLARLTSGLMIISLNCATAPVVVTKNKGCENDKKKFSECYKIVTLVNRQLTKCNQELENEALYLKKINNARMYAKFKYVGIGLGAGAAIGLVLGIVLMVPRK